MDQYDVMSDKAECFISHQEIIEVLDEAEERENNVPLLMSYLDEAEAMQGLSYDKAVTLLLARNPEVNARIFALAEKIKNAYYGNRIVLFAPLYLSNYCVNHCVYCPYHAKNKHIYRKKMTQDEIRREVIALQDMGHKRLALEAGEDPVNNPLEYILESIDTIYSIHHEAGSIRRVNVNIAATTVENYHRLHEAKIGTYILFQETYNRLAYKTLHPRGPKADYAYHTEAMDRAFQGGLEDVGLGVLFGLQNYAYEFVGLLMHAEHLERKYGAGPHTISVPRLRPADDIDVSSFKNALPDEVFLKIVALLRIAVPYTGLIISTRESQRVREQALKLGVSQISGGSKTSVGGYAAEDVTEEDSAQFEIADHRSLDEVVRWLMELGYLPSFCTACYGKGRQGVDFMEICKKKQIHNFCSPNALLTLSEYLNNYASPETAKVGLALTSAEMKKLPEATQRAILKRLNQALQGDVKFL
jgi:2-iminoacetate synthase